MIPEIWKTQCAWCGSLIQIQRECANAAVAARQGKSGPIIVCAMCAEGNTIETIEFAGCPALTLIRTEAEHMENMRRGLNSSNAAPYIKRRLN